MKNTFRLKRIQASLALCRNLSCSLIILILSNFILLNSYSEEKNLNNSLVKLSDNLDELRVVVETNDAQFHNFVLSTLGTYSYLSGLNFARSD